MFCGLMMALHTACDYRRWRALALIPPLAQQLRLQISALRQLIVMLTTERSLSVPDQNELRHRACP
ncbi:hypothetical protein GCM10010946_22700 [Undibacterium squillarum]|uniref:Uncharacterized protein n=1 Tax=Undibacterium squillarum TaxID=1131567 RepID=A0ABQ2XZS3_9BURK|nr:hypothetical protein GCM10010946_22700 [Undibacterium squillarum]